MGYKVTISDGTILEKSIESVTFNADTPSDDFYCMRTHTINSITITGKIGAGEKTISLYEWSLLAASNPDCYKEIVVEYIHAGQIIRNVTFSKAFVVDYSESYSKCEGVGHFSIFIRQLAGVDIECANETTQQSMAIETAPTKVSEESILPQVLEAAVTATSIAKKDRPKATDILAKINLIQDNGNAGISEPDIEIGKADLDALRKKWNVPETDTIAVGKTDVKGLEDLVFEGGSPKVRTEAGFENYDITNPDRAIKSCGKIPSATRHAEEVVANEFAEAVKKAAIKPEDVIGTLRIHQSNPSGVCPTCLSGLGNPIKAAGIIKQLSIRYPNLTIGVTSETVEGVKVIGNLAFKVKNGVYIV